MRYEDVQRIRQDHRQAPGVHRGQLIIRCTCGAHTYPCGARQAADQLAQGWEPAEASR